ncbi:MAG TPA: NHL repeat-containing protein [Gammaproteobacteria bacterium]
MAGGQTVVLQNNGGDDLPVSANGTFVFSEPLASTKPYDVTVRTQPVNGQSCALVSNSAGSTGSGTVASSNVTTVRISCYSVFTFAGSGVVGTGNATGQVAVFRNPSGMAMDKDSNLYVADTGDDYDSPGLYHGNVIRKITPAGVVTTLAGSGLEGFADGTGPEAQFNFVQDGMTLAGVAVDGAGNLYVADNGNHAIRKITPNGVVTTLAGSGMAGHTDATGSAAQFNSPRGIAVDGAGNVYVGDTLNHVIRKISSTGVVTTLAGTVGVNGYVDGTGTAAQFAFPKGVALDADGNLYVADTVKIRKITPAGVVTTLAGVNTLDYLDATGAAARFVSPQGIAVDGTGNVYVTEHVSSLHPAMGVRMISPAGVVSTLAGPGHGFADGPATQAEFYYPQGLAVSAAGDIYVADGINDRIRTISAKPYGYTIGGRVVGLTQGSGLVLQNNGGETLTVNDSGQFTFATPASDLSGAPSYDVAVLTQPAGKSCTVSNGSGGFVAGDVLNIKVNCAEVSTVAGSGFAGWFDSSDALTAQFDDPSGVAVDTDGNLYVADIDQHLIRKITAAGVVSTLAGGGEYGYFDGVGTAALFGFSGPTGLAVDASGNVYVGDTGNNVIRKITAAGVVTTLAGGGPMYVTFADGTGTAARFDSPRGVALDSTGEILYVADDGNHAIRKVTTAGGVVTTLAGGGGDGLAGYVNATGAAARFTRPKGVAVDASGNVFVADTDNASVRKITPAGVVSTVAGIGITANLFYLNYRDSTGSGATFFGPSSIAVDSSGNLYVNDVSAIRTIDPHGTVTTLAGSAELDSGYLDGNGASALFDFGCSSVSDAGLAVDASGHLYVGDPCNNRIRKVIP